MYQTPEQTSVNNEEFKPNQCVIPFAPELIDFILAKKKLTTYRFGNKYNYLNVGDLINLQNSSTRNMVATAIITRKANTTFKDIPIKTGGHESYRNKEHQRQVLSGYYAYIGRKIADDDQFLVFDFKLIDTNK